jgi:hypothetical protein
MRAWLGHGESRRLFDLTLVSIRRELLAGRWLKPVTPRSLVQTRSEAIIRLARSAKATRNHAAAICRLSCIGRQMIVRCSAESAQGTRQEPVRPRLMLRVA